MRWRCCCCSAAAASSGFFPLWVLQVSVSILVGNLRKPPQTSAPVLEEKKHD